MINLLLEISPILPNGSTQTLHLSSRGVDPSGTQFDDGYQWLPLITQKPSRTVSWSDEGILGETTVSYTPVVFEMSDEIGVDNEHWSTWQWQGAYCRMWLGDEGQPFSAYEQIYEGSAGAIERNGMSASLPILSIDHLVDRNLLTRTYGGTNTAGGPEGPAALRGVLKPFAAGVCANVEPILVDRVGMIYQYHAYGSTKSVDAVYENALSLEAPFATASTWAELAALTIPDGKWAAAPAIGAFRLANQPTGKITADVSGAMDGGTFPTTVGAIMSMMIKTTGVPADRIADTLKGRTESYCFYTTEQVVVGEELRAAMLSCGCASMPSKDGKFSALDFYALNPTSIKLNSEVDVFPVVRSYRQLAVAPPVWQVKVSGDRCWSTHSEAEISQLVGVISAQFEADALEIKDAKDRADLAQAVANAQARRVDEILADNVLDRGEKSRENATYESESAIKIEMMNRSSQFDVTAQRASYLAAFNNLSLYLNSLSPSFFDLTQSTPVNSDYDAYWKAYEVAKVVLANAMTGDASRTAIYDSVAGTPKTLTAINVDEGEKLETVAIGADVTKDNTSKDTANVGGKPSTEIVFAIDKIPTIQENIAATESDINDLFATYGNTESSKTNADAAEAAKLVAQAAETNATKAFTASQAARDAAQSAQALASGFATNAAGSASNASGSASTANTAAAQAAQAKLDAMAASSAAQTASDLARGFSNQAADNSSYAFQAMGAAQVARDASQAARDVASEASTQAYANAQASQRYVGDAQGWASTASGHASTASQQATASSQSAEAANASSMAANTKAGEASISASQAISAKNDADGYRNSAATSANVSASNARDAAANSANENRAPGAAPSLWSYNQYNTFAPTSRITDDPSNYNSVNGNLHANGGHVHPVAPKRVQPGHRYRAYVRFRMLSDGAQSAGHYLYVTYFDAAGNLLLGNTVAVAYSLSNYTVADGYQEITVIIGPNEPGAGRMPGTVAFARIMYRLSGQSEEIALLYLEDVEGELAAASSALASATSASNAATSKIGADEAASASTTAKTAAETARGDAQTFASQASSSNETAAGSASTATQQAGVASTASYEARIARDQAGSANTQAQQWANDSRLKAEASQGSASTASSKADAAGQSAEAASASASIANTKAGEASASAATAVSAKNDADGYRNSAASSASLSASTYKKFVDVDGNGDFVNGTDGWENTQDIIGVASSYGRYGVIRTSAGQNYNGILGSKMPVTSADQRFKLRASWRCAEAKSVYYFGACFYRADGSLVAANDGTGNYPLGAATQLDSSTDGWLNREAVIGKGVLQGSAYGTQNIPEDTAYFRPIMFLNYTSIAGSVTEVDYFTVEDITSESNSATAAKASFDSAQTASASATLSGQNASASDGSRIAAETARGLAETYRNQAAQSRDDAAGSSSSASTASGIAVSAKDAANNTALHLHPTTFEQGELFFAGDAGHPIPQGVTWNSGTYTTLPNGGYGVISWKSAIPHVPGNFYRIRARVSAPGAGGQAELRVSTYTTQIAPQSRLSVAAATGNNVPANTWSWIEFTTEALNTTDPWIKPEIVLSYPNQTVQVSIAALELLDVTSEVIAKDAAVASSNSASSASASNDQAGQRASAADTSRQQAAGSAGEALVYRNTTANYASDAQGSANTATSQAGIATQAKVDATNRAAAAANLAEDALRYANASSASASTASSKASESSQSATASDLSRQQAAGSAGDALAYRNTTADYASSAQGSSSNATTQAGIATTASFRAANEASKTVVADWNDLNGFVEPSSAGGLFNKDRPAKNFTQWTSFPVISEGKVLQVGNGGDSNVITTRGSIKIEAGKFYSLTGRTRLIQAVTNSAYDPYTYFGWCGYDAAGTYLGNYYTYAQPMPVLNQWYQHDQLLSFDDLKAWVPAVAYISPMVLTNYRDEQSGLNSVMQVSALSGRDATAERNAQVSATAAASSASTAITKASEAGQSASAALASQTAAGTSEGNALTYRNEASQSATNALGSSNSAASSQGVAATAAAAASASAKATVPDNFTDPGSWYEWNAWGGSVTFANGLANIKNGGSFLSNFRIPLGAGEHYRVTARHRTINQGGGTTYIGTLIGGQNYWRIGGKPTAAVNQWETSTFEISGDTIIAEQGQSTGIQIGLLTGYPNTSDAEVSMFRIENIAAEMASRNNATASASSASAAAASKIGADQSASAANTSATNALTSEGKANTSATNASRSEQNAAGSSQTASASQQLAAASNASATLAAAANFPATFEQGAKFFADLTGSPLEAEPPYHATAVVDGTSGPVLRITDPTPYHQLRTRNLVPNTVAAQVWRVETKVRVVQHQNKSITFVTNAYGLGADQRTIFYSGQISSANGVREGASFAVPAGDLGWHVIGQEFVTSGNTCPWIAPTCYIVDQANPQGSYAGVILEFGFHRVTNVTSEKAANDYATAANGSASTAGTKADAAGRSAEAANQSKLDAEAANGKALASATAANTSQVAATAAASSAQTSALISSSYSSASMAINDKFANWTDAAAYPVGWGVWSQEANFRKERATPGLGSQYYVRTLSDGPGNQGFYQTVQAYPGKFVISATAMLDAGGSWDGAGLWFYERNTSIGFASEADDAGVVSPTLAGQVRTWSKLITFAGNGATNLHAMHGFSAFGTVTAKYLRWYGLSIRPASAAEIAGDKALTSSTANTARIEEVNRVISTDASSVATRTSSLETRAGNLESSVTTTQGAVSNLNGRTAAFWKVGAVAGNGRASLSVYADANGGGGVDIGGDVRIGGSAIIDGTLSANKLQIKSRGISTEGIDFKTQVVNGAMELTWGAGAIRYNNTSGNADVRGIAGGNTYGVVKTCYIYWIEGESSFRVSSQAGDVYLNGNAVMIATFDGGTKFNVTYGGTIVDGDRITTGSITADRMNVGSLSAITANIGEVTAGLIRSADNTASLNLGTKRLSFVTGDWRVVNGSSIGPNANMVQWFGPNSVAVGSETIANSRFALANDGRIYYGAAELAAGGGASKQTVGYETTLTKMLAVGASISFEANVFKEAGGVGGELQVVVYGGVAGQSLGVVASQAVGYVGPNEPGGGGLTGTFTNNTGIKKAFVFQVSSNGVGGNIRAGQSYLSM